MNAFTEWLTTDSAAYASIAMVILCSVITLQNLIMHLVNYTRDDLQRHVTRIILVVPIYTIASWMELTHPDSAIVGHAVVDFWEALVIYSFFNLILEYVGGEHNWLVCVQHTHPEGLSHTVPFNWCFPKRMDLDPTWLRNCKMACFQFVFIKPLVGIVFLPFLFAGTYYDPPWPVIRDVVYNITYTLALYALALLYMTTHEHPSLKPKRPLAKFVTVKLVIFFTYWQRYFLVFLDLSDKEMSDLLAFLTMIEMTLVAIPINWIAFPWREFQSGLLDTSNMMELIETGQNSPSEKLKAGVSKFNVAMGHAMKIFSPEDMVENASQNLRSKYKTHVLLESSQEYVIEENPIGDPSDSASSPADSKTAKSKKKRRVFKAKTYLIGGLSGMSPTSESSDRSPVSVSSNPEPPSAPTTQPAVIGQALAPLEESPPPSPRHMQPSVVVPLLPMPPKARAGASSTQFVRLEEDLDDEDDKKRE